MTINPVLNPKCIVCGNPLQDPYINGGLILDDKSATTRRAHTGRCWTCQRLLQSVAVESISLGDFKPAYD